MSSRFAARTRWFAKIWIVWIVVELFGAIFTWSRTITGEIAPAPGWIWYHVAATVYWACLTPLVVWLSRRVPLERGAWIGAVLIHLCAIIAMKTLEGALVWSIQPWIHGGHRLTFAQTLPRYAFVHAFTYAGIVAVENALRYHRLYVDRRLRAVELEAQVTRAQLTALQMQIRPHFLYNVLNTVSGLVRTDAKQAAVEMLAALGDLLRSLLREEGAHEVTVSQELELIGRYLHIQQIRFGDRLQVTLAVDAGTEQALVPHLILQPLVENAILHGLDTPGWVSIRVARHGEVLRLEVSSSGRSSQREPGNGVGLRNTRARLERLYGPNHRLDLQHTATGTSVVVELPMHAVAT